MRERVGAAEASQPALEQRGRAPAALAEMPLAIGDEHPQAPAGRAGRGDPRELSRQDLPGILLAREGAAAGAARPVDLAEHEARRRGRRAARVERVGLAHRAVDVEDVVGTRVLREEGDGALRLLLGRPLEERLEAAREPGGEQARADRRRREPSGGVGRCGAARPSSAGQRPGGAPGERLEPGRERERRGRIEEEEDARVAARHGQGAREVERERPRDGRRDQRGAREGRGLAAQPAPQQVRRPERGERRDERLAAARDPRHGSREQAQPAPQPREERERPAAREEAAAEILEQARLPVREHEERRDGARGGAAGRDDGEGVRGGGARRPARSRERGEKQRRQEERRREGEQREERPGRERPAEPPPARPREVGISHREQGHRGEGVRRVGLERGALRHEARREREERERRERRGRREPAAGQRGEERERGQREEGGHGAEGRVRLARQRDRRAHEQQEQGRRRLQPRLVAQHRGQARREHRVRDPGLVEPEASPEPVHAHRGARAQEEGPRAGLPAHARPSHPRSSGALLLPLRSPARGLQEPWRVRRPHEPLARRPHEPLARAGSSRCVDRVI
jgi:hypothetical protein